MKRVGGRYVRTNVYRENVLREVYCRYVAEWLCSFFFIEAGVNFNARLINFTRVIDVYFAMRETMLLRVL